MPNIPSKSDENQLENRHKRPEITFSPAGDSTSLSDDDSLDEKRNRNYLSDTNLPNHRRFLSEKSDQNHISALCVALKSQGSILR